MKENLKLLGFFMIIDTREVYWGLSKQFNILFRVKHFKYSFYWRRSRMSDLL